MGRRDEVEVRGKISRVRFCNGTNHYTVADLVPGPSTDKGLFGSADSGRSITILGYLPGIKEGDELDVSGRWVQHAKYGMQVQVERYERVIPTSPLGIATYLASGSIQGVGPKTAAKIVGEFGGDALKVIEEDPDRLAQIRGVGRKRAEKIRQSLLSQRESERVMLFLYDHGITPGTAARLYRQYGQATIPVVRDNPYQLIDEVYGVGFLTADRIARSTGVLLHAPERLAAAARHVLSVAAANEGHTFLPEQSLYERVCGLVNSDIDSDLAEPVDADEVAAAVQRLVRSGRLVRDDDRLYLGSLFEAESSLASRLGELARVGVTRPDPGALEKALERVERELGVEYAELQRDAIRMVTRSSVSVITGGPGTGKTTVVNGLTRALDLVFGEQRKLLACPTGRAAKRLSEATGLTASTIHRLLGWQPDPDGGWRFERDRDNPLVGDLLIVDETSMIDVSLGWQLIQAVPDGMRVVFVGDADQLPSVGPGNVLKDMIGSGALPTVRLNTIFRQGERSGIVTAAHEIREGKGPDRSFWSRGDGLPGRDFAFVRRDEAEDAARTTVEFAIGLAEQGSNVQVLAPMYRGVCGVDSLNRQLQESLNPGRPGVPELRLGTRLFRLGDRVMQIRNNYEKEVFNGDIGYVAGIETGIGTERKFELVVEFEGVPVRYRDDDVDELVLAYAVTVHKSQGSEFEAVVLAVVRGHYVMLRRNLIYTAVSRAKRQMIVVGEPRALWAAVRNDEVVRRWSRLSERLSGD